MKIAMIGQKGIDPEAGGVERHVEEIGARLVEKGHQVDVFCRPHYARMPETWRGMRVRMLPSINTKHLDAITHTLVSTLASWGAGYDVIHYHALGPTALSPAARLTHARVVSTCHGLDWRRQKWGLLARTLLRAAEWPTARFPHKLITVSRVLAEYFHEKYNVDAVYIPNGFQVPDQLADLREIAIRWGLTEPGREGRYVLFMARLVPEKGAHTLIEAYRKVKDGARLVIAGGASHSARYAEDLRDMAGGDKRVIFTGGVSGRVWSELLSNAALFVLPSTMEGLPIGLLEAMGHARPCLASDIPENLEILEPEDGGGRVGLVFPAGDADALAEAIDGALRTPERMEVLGRQARDMVERRYRWDLVTDRVDAVYRGLLTSP